MRAFHIYKNPKIQQDTQKRLTSKFFTIMK